MHFPLAPGAVRIAQFLLLTLALLCGCVGFAPQAQGRASRQLRPFDAGWRFFQGDLPGAEQPSFNDNDWRTVSLPHDWAIAGPFNANNPTGGVGAFLPSGVVWYRKHFVVPAAYKHRRIFIEFAGVMANSDVWLNGILLGHRPYGYVSFRYEISGLTHFGGSAQNVVAVRCDTSKQPASRWYEGGGIYRHVRLLVTGPVHVAQWATFVSTPLVSDTEATIRVETNVRNQDDASKSAGLKILVYSPDGTLAASTSIPPQTIAAGHAADYARDLRIARPDRWDVAHPALYRAVVLVRVGGRTVDEDAVSFGIREFHFDAATGFWLNGRNMKLYGVCLHADGGPFGIAVPLDVWRQRLEALRALGVNAIRTAHNPVSPEFLSLCDRMGFLVMDEFFDCWTVGKTPYDYHLYFSKWYKQDTRDTVRRDRNHPSIILYSAGNEIHDTPNTPLAHEILASLVSIYHATDPTRPVTQALFRPNVSHDYQNGLADMLDVVGQNYRTKELLAAHAEKPSRKILGTEDGLDRATWLALRDHPEMAGEFLWAGIDYLGESHAWPYIGRPVGLLDRTGSPHPAGLQRQSWWSDTPTVHMVRRVASAAPAVKDPGYEQHPQQPTQALFQDWTPFDRAPHMENVEVYSNGEQVELFLNGKTLGTKPIAADASPRIWTVAFAPGVLRAVASNHGVVVATEELRTAGKAASVTLHADRKKLAKGFDSVAFVTATITDKNGVTVPNATEAVHFSVRGPGRVVAVDDADNSVQGWTNRGFETADCSAFQSRCVAFVQATASHGAITVTAVANGLAGSAVTVTATKERVEQE